MLVEITYHCQVLFLKTNSCTKTILRINSLKFDKGLMLDVDICTYNILVLLAQPFAIKLSTSHPLEIDRNNCLSKHIHFLVLFALVSFHCQN